MGGHLGKNLVIAVSLLAAGFLVAWLRFRPYLGTEGAFTDGDRTIEIERIERLRYAVWDDPVPMAGEINSTETERAPAVSPDGRHVVFAVGERGLGTDLWIADLDARGAAFDPRPLPVVNSVADEVAPSFSADGALLFASNRAGGMGGLDLWRAPYARGAFDAPEWLGEEINSTADDTDPAAVPWTDELVFASARAVPGETAVRGALRDFDLFVARPRPPGPPGGEDTSRESSWAVAPLSELNSGFEERDPSFGSDGRALLFASDREGGLGAFDLYRAARAPDGLRASGVAEEWLAPRPLEGVNSSASERDPRATADGFALLFTRADAALDARADVWRARSRELVRTPGPPIGWREILVLAALLLLALLAALAKRWRGLDVLYKAFLVSLLVHLLMLWWFRDVVPESEEYELHESDGTRVRIRLVDDPSSLSAQRNVERSGEVEAERTEVQASATPERSDAADARERAVEAAAPSRLEALLAKGEAAPASAPERADAAEAERTAEVNDADADVREIAESFERLSAAAPALAAPEAAEASAAARADTAAEDARRADAAAESRPFEPVDPVAASAAALERGARDASAESSAPVRREVVVDRAEEVASRAETADGLSVDAPSSDFERMTGDARGSNRPIEVAAADGASLDGRARRAEPTATASEAAADAAVRPALAAAAAPSEGADLERGERSAPVARGTEFERAGGGAPRRQGDRIDVSVAQPAAGEVPRRSGASSAPTFDALEGAGSSASEVARGDALPSGVDRTQTPRQRREPAAASAAAAA
ncbi:MAG: hypothetical protein AAGB93_09545, partial [Planctomycetota bacterium]